ncbi:hypothetical protein KCP78_15780 [Salmonella enterica subsp. enterica]|nr:hypothetical protein KCP78_15780 [Salmonella enterica subsp. enterica]
MLLSQIQRQRLDLSANRRDWLETYHRRVRSRLEYGVKPALWALVGIAGVVAILDIRHPNMMLVRWAKRGTGIWSARRTVKTPPE